MSPAMKIVPGGTRVRSLHDAWHSLFASNDHLIVPTAVMNGELPSAPLRMYAFLYHAAITGQPYTGGQKGLVAVLSLSTRQIRRAQDTLLERGFIEIERSGRSLTYVVRDPSEAHNQASTATDTGHERPLSEANSGHGCPQSAPKASSNKCSKARVDTTSPTEELRIQDQVLKDQDLSTSPENLKASTLEENRDGVSALKNAGGPPDVAGLDLDQMRAIRRQADELFAQMTHLRIPKGNGEAGARWWAPLREMLDLVDWRVDELQTVLTATIEAMDLNYLTYDSPASCLRTFRAMQARVKRPSMRPADVAMRVALEMCPDADPR